MVGRSGMKEEGVTGEECVRKVKMDCYNKNFFFFLTLW